jgi:hypothetical protein
MAAGIVGRVGEHMTANVAHSGLGENGMDKKFSISQTQYAKIQDTFHVLQMNLNALQAIIENTYVPSVAIRPGKDQLTIQDRDED